MRNKNCRSGMCRKCSTETRTTAERCPMCGASYAHGFRRMSHRAKVVLVVSALFVLLMVAGAGAALKISHDNHVQAQHRQAQVAANRAAQQRQAAAQQRQAAQQAKQAQNQFNRTLRRGMVTELEKSITKDARQRVSAAPDLFTGPILTTQCEPAMGRRSTTFRSPPASSVASLSIRRTQTAPFRAIASQRRWTGKAAVRVGTSVAEVRSENPHRHRDGCVVCGRLGAGRQHLCCPRLALAQVLSEESRPSPLPAPQRRLRREDPRRR